VSHFHLDIRIRLVFNRVIFSYMMSYFFDGALYLKLHAGVPSSVAMGDYFGAAWQQMRDYEAKTELSR